MSLYLNFGDCPTTLNYNLVYYQFHKCLLTVIVRPGLLSTVLKSTYYLHHMPTI